MNKIITSKNKNKKDLTNDELLCIIKTQQNERSNTNGKNNKKQTD